MKVSEILNDENHKTVTRLLSFLDGQTYGAEIEQIKQHLVKEGTKPTLEHVKRHLVHHLLLPTELMNEPERSIIIRQRAPSKVISGTRVTDAGYYMGSVIAFD